ncbi:heavy metal-associated domain-containing protein [Flavobacterium sp.]|uniref:heavy-metal-associated domain-containing protein n=1 Tax=Flavobacterium sp. TaxID=239 RepID=UPI00286DB5D5|nr:heavy metal-associated domain-containing protein [Flavobacterium sp.]
MKKSYKYVTLLALALLSLSNANAQISKAEIRATGLTCSMCSNAINKQLKALPEVANVATDLNTNTFTVTLKENNTISPTTFKQSVEKAGFSIGSLVLTSKTSAIKNEKYIVVDAKTIDSEEVTFQVLDKGYVTDKEYKKLSKSLKKLETYLANNEDDFHIKILN